MGFIDWLKKDKDVKINDEDMIDINNQNDEEEQEDFNDDDLTSLKELSNSEREESLSYNNDEEDDEDQNSFNLSNNNSFGYSAQPQNASFTIFKVEDEEDVRQVLKHLTNGAPCIASFEKIKKKEYNLIMKYLQGGLFVMGANMSEWQNSSYILVPRGMSINMQEKSRRKK